MRIINFLAFAGSLFVSTMFCSVASAQDVPPVSGAVCGYCGTRLPNGVHSSGCPYYAGPSSHGGIPLATPTRKDVQTMVVGSVIQGLIGSFFAPSPANSARQQQAAALAARKAAEQKRIEEALAQAKYEEMMKSYKLSGASAGVAMKSLDAANNAAVARGTDENVADALSKPFDTPADRLAADSIDMKTGTAFFGDSMALPDIQTLIEPENDPSVVDLREARSYLIENHKNDSAAIVKTISQYQENETKVLNRQDCGKLALKLKGYMTQRQQFQKTIDLAQQQLTTWEEANRNALVNAAKEGLGLFMGKLLDHFKKRAEAAGRLAGIYEKNAAKMTAKGINTEELQRKIDRLKALSSLGQFVGLEGDANNWQSFINNGLQAMLEQLAASNREISAMIQDPAMQEFFGNESPTLSALLDLSTIANDAAILGKWVAKQAPLIAYTQFAVNQIYNGFDWWLSYKRIKEANRINGGVLATAQYIQNNIEKTCVALQDCP